VATTVEAAHPEPVERALSELQSVTRRARHWAEWVSTVTAAHVGFLFVGPGIARLLSLPLTVEAAFGVAAAELFMLASWYVALRQFDAAGQRGNVLFQEISDELEWGRRRPSVPGTVRDPEVWGMPPSFETRVVLRDFQASLRLPFVPAGAGPAVYAGVNLLLTLTFIVIFTPALSPLRF